MKRSSAAQKLPKTRRAAKPPTTKKLPLTSLLNPKYLKSKDKDVQKELDKFIFS